MTVKIKTDIKEGALFYDCVLNDTLKLIDILPTENYSSRFWLCERTTGEISNDYVIRDEADIYDCFYYRRGE